MASLYEVVASPAEVKPSRHVVRRRTQGFRDRLASIILGRRRLRSQVGLIASLNEVADAVSSAIVIEEVLECIVERAKSISDTDKAVLVLTDDHGSTLDLETLVVRGRRSQHLQEWWQERLEALGDEVFLSHQVAVEYHPEHSAWLLASPIRVKDHPIGLICAINADDRPFSEMQVDFLAILSAFAASAIENARLAEQGRYVLLASERDRIAHEMHDGVIQSLFSISLGLELCKKLVFRDPGLVATRLDDLQGNLNVAMSELRRFVYDLRPMKLNELGLAGAIEYWIREVTLSRETKGSLIVEGMLPRLSAATEACLYRVAKESVSNVVKHSHASHFEVRLTGAEDHVRLVITDDGCGFAATEVINGDGPGLGLKSIRERVNHEGGTWSVESSPTGGTTITVELLLGGS